MRRLNEAQLTDEAWRLNVQDFAERISKGRWKSFTWLDVMLGLLSDSLINGNARIIINAPPRHGKSEAISHWLPVWFLDWNPDARVILASYSDTYAARWGLAVRDEFQPSKETWTRIRPDKAQASDWQTTFGGGMRSVGIGGSVTGHGGNLVIVDDPHKDWEEAMSLAAREKVNDWVEGTIAPRLEPGGSMVVMQTRWHQDDLTGRLLAKADEHWTLLNFPAIAEDENDLLGRKPGEPLCPERYSTQALEGIRSARGPYRWAGLYQQRPAPFKGGIVKREWFGIWRSGEIPSDGRWIITIDPTQKATGSSYFVAQVWCQTSRPSAFYLVDQFRDHVSFLESVKTVLRLKNSYPQVESVIVEESANGPALVDTLKSNIPGLQARRVRTSKEARLIAVSGIVESGAVRLPESSKWIDGFLAEVLAFPNATNDDQVDAMTLALDYLASQPVASFGFEIPMSGSRANQWKELNG